MWGGLKPAKACGPASAGPAELARQLVAAALQCGEDGIQRAIVNRPCPGVNAPHQVVTPSLQVLVCPVVSKQFAAAKQPDTPDQIRRLSLSDFTTPFHRDNCIAQPPGNYVASFITMPRNKSKEPRDKSPARLLYNHT